MESKKNSKEKIIMTIEQSQSVVAIPLSKEKKKMVQIGRRNIVVIPGIICAVAGAAFAFVRSLIPLMILLLIVSLAQGGFTAAPYIIVGLINERKDVPKAMGMLATAIAVGGFGGSIIAGNLTDMGLLTVAILMP